MNIIEIFQRGNQELFHSAFIAWLMNKNGEHGLGDNFARRLFESAGYTCDSDYEVITEHTEGDSRYDIFIKPKKDMRALVLENKVKSFGHRVQVESYLKKGHHVAFLSLFRETLENTKGIKVILYDDILKDLDACILNASSSYHFLISEYKNFIHDQLQVFKAIKSYCYEDKSLQKMQEDFRQYLPSNDMRENDRRTIHYYIYYNFAEYMQNNFSPLIFGHLDEKEADEKKDNTKWLYEKNMRGGSFMTAHIHNFQQSNMKFRLKSDLCDLHATMTNPFTIAPRIELYFDPNQMKNVNVTEDHEVGRIMICTWTEELIAYLKNHKSYCSVLRKMGRRHFHYETISLKDMVFSRLEYRIKQMLSIMGVFQN
jgi:hypothetical protein